MIDDQLHPPVEKGAVGCGQRFVCYQGLGLSQTVHYGEARCIDTPYNGQIVVNGVGPRVAEPDVVLIYFLSCLRYSVSLRADGIGVSSDLDG